MVNILLQGELMKNLAGVVMKFVFICIVQGVFSVHGVSGERTFIRGMGMARTSVVVSRGIDALGTNPANLALPDEGRVTFSMMPFGIHAGTQLINFGLYQQYFTGMETDSGRVGYYLTEREKEHLLSALPNTLPQTRVDAEVLLAGLSVRMDGVGSMGISITEHFGGYMNLSSDYLRFLFHGNTAGSEYAFHGTTMMAAWTREYAVGFAGALPRVPFVKWWAFGVAAKLVHGFGYFEVEKFNTSLITSSQGMLTGVVDFRSRAAGSTPFESPFQLFPHPSGTGFGVDVGTSAKLNDVLLVGLSVTDIGSLRWSGNLNGYTADTTLIIDDPLDESQRSAVENALEGRQYQPGSFSASLPTTLRIGMAVEAHKLDFFAWMGGGLLLAFDYTQGLVNSTRSTTTPRVSAGFEYSPWSWLPLRSGISFGGTDGMNVGLGLGILLGTFEMELATENAGWLFQSSSFSYGSIAMGTRLRF